MPHADLTATDLENIRQLKAGWYDELYRLLFIGDTLKVPGTPSRGQR